MYIYKNKCYSTRKELVKDIGGNTYKRLVKSKSLDLKMIPNELIDNLLRNNK